jgi:hypothetical protein
MNFLRGLEGDFWKGDVFYESYKQIYKYANERIRVIAQKMKSKWLKDYIDQD